MQQSGMCISATPGSAPTLRGRPKACFLRGTTGISIRIDLKDKTDQWAYLHNMSRSSAIEIFVERALQQEENNAIIQCLD